MLILPPVKMHILSPVRPRLAVIKRAQYLYVRDSIMRTSVRRRDFDKRSKSLNLAETILH